MLNFGGPLWVSCEISQLNVSRGHYYLVLIQKDEHSEEIVAQSTAVLWYRDFLRLRRKHADLLEAVLAETHQVRLLVEVDFHERYGLKLVIRDIDPAYTLGQFAERRTQIIRRLEAEDLLERNASCPLPSVIQHIAVISSETAAGFADFLAQLRENEFGYDFRVHLFPAAMQGKQVVPEVMAQLHTIKKRRKSFDVVAIIRGGGSKMDLADFDSYELGKMIAEFPMPVVTGIGHEIDESVADLVAAQAFKTPTAVAAWLVRHNMEAEQDLLLLEENIAHLVREMILDAGRELDMVVKTIPVLLRTLLEGYRRDVHEWEEAWRRLVRQTVRDKYNDLKHVTALIEAVHPKRLLAKGYSITYHRGQPVRNVRDLKPGDRIETYLHRGRFESEVLKKYPR